MKSFTRKLSNSISNDPWQAAHARLFWIAAAAFGMDIPLVHTEKEKNNKKKSGRVLLHPLVADSADPV